VGAARCLLLFSLLYFEGTVMADPIVVVSTEVMAAQPVYWQAAPAPASNGSDRKVEHRRNGAVVATYVELGDLLAQDGRYGSPVTPLLPGDEVWVYPARYYKGVFFGGYSDAILENVTVKGITVNGVRPVLYYTGGDHTGQPNEGYGYGQLSLSNQGVVYVARNKNCIWDNIDIMFQGGWAFSLAYINNSQTGTVTFKNMRAYNAYTLGNNGFFSAVGSMCGVTWENVETGFNGGDGGAPPNGGGQALRHGYYITRHDDSNALMTWRGCYFHHNWKGHLLKVRHNRVLIEGCYFMGSPPESLNDTNIPVEARIQAITSEACLVDMSNGGELTCRNNVFVKSFGGYDSSSIMLNWSPESDASQLGTNSHTDPKGALTVHNNTFIAYSDVGEARVGGGNNKNVPHSFGAYFGMGTPDSGTWPSALCPVSIHDNTYAGFTYSSWREATAQVLTLDQVNLPGRDPDKLPFSPKVIAQSSDGTGGKGFDMYVHRAFSAKRNDTFKGAVGALENVIVPTGNPTGILMSPQNNNSAAYRASGGTLTYPVQYEWSNAAPAMKIASAVINPAAPNAIVITFSIDGDPVGHGIPLYTAWKITGHNVTEYDFDNGVKGVTLYTDAPFIGGQIYTLSYTRPPAPDGFAAANDGYLESFVNMPVTNNVPVPLPPSNPMTIVSAVINGVGFGEVLLTFSEDIDRSHELPPFTAWTIANRQLINYRYFDDPKKLGLLVDTVFKAGDTTALTYRRPLPPVGIAATGNNYLESFSNVAVQAGGFVPPPVARPIPAPVPLLQAKPVPSWVPTNQVSVKTFGAVPGASPQAIRNGFNQAFQAIKSLGGGTVYVPPGQYDFGVANDGDTGFMIQATDLNKVALLGYGVTLVWNTTVILQTNLLCLYNPQDVIVMGVSFFDRGFDPAYEWKGGHAITLFHDKVCSNFTTVDIAAENCLSLCKILPAVEGAQFGFTNAKIHGSATYCFYGVTANFTGRYSELDLTCSAVRRGWIAYGARDWKVKIRCHGVNGMGSNGFLDPIAYTNAPCENISVDLYVTGSVDWYVSLMQYYNQGDAASYYRNVDCKITLDNVYGVTRMFLFQHQIGEEILSSSDRPYEQCYLSGEIIGNFDGTVVRSNTLSTATTNEIVINESFEGHQDFSTLPAYFRFGTVQPTLFPDVDLGVVKESILVGSHAKIRGTVDLRNDPTGTLEVSFYPKPSGVIIGPFTVPVINGKWEYEHALPPGVYDVHLAAQADGHTSEIITEQITMRGLTGKALLPKYK
jgi:hypothetical protein